RTHPHITQITPVSSRRTRRPACRCATVCSRKLLSTFLCNLRNLWIEFFGGGAGNRTRIQKPTPKDSTCLAASLFVRSFDRTSFAQRRVSEIARPQHELVRLCLTHHHGPKRWASSSKVTSPSARMSNLRRRRSLAVLAARANSLELAIVVSLRVLTSCIR